MIDEEKQIEEMARVMMRDRLISLLCGVECAGSDRREGGCGYRDSAKCNRIEKLDHCMVACIADHLLANSDIVLPCKVGDTVWFELHGQIEAAVIYHCTYESTHRGFILLSVYAKDTRGIELIFNQNSLGKGVFLTREEAERALKGEHNAEIH